MYNNEFSLGPFKRFYCIENSSLQPMRGWHAHRFESKAFVSVFGKIRIGAVEVQDWAHPDRNAEIFSQELGPDTADVYFVPAGFANGILSLEPGARVMVFSSATLQESMQDDYRFDKDFWKL